MDLKKAILKAARDRTKLVDIINEQMQKSVAKSQADLLQRFIDEWVDKLDTDDAGNVKNTLRNKRLLQNIDVVYDRYVQQSGIEIAQTIAEGVQKVIDFNGQYYGAFAEEAQVVKIQPQVAEFVKGWLGVGSDGTLIKNGYLHKIVSGDSIRNELKNIAVRSVVGQRGYESLKASVKQFIAGGKDTTGALQKYYRNFAYDTISKVDRATALVYADALELNYAIYEGGLIETSRTFCKEHNGKVYTRKEIAEMQPTEGIAESYDPFTDMGGFACRHHWNWIPKAVAYALRPELMELEKAA